MTDRLMHHKTGEKTGEKDAERSHGSSASELAPALQRGQLSHRPDADHLAPQVLSAVDVRNDCFVFGASAPDGARLASELGIARHPQTDATHEFRVRRSESASRDNPPPLALPAIDSTKTHTDSDGIATVAYADGSKIALSLKGSVEITTGDATAHQRLTPAEQQFLERHKSDTNMQHVAQLHYRYHNHPEWIESFYKQLNRLDDSPALSPQDAARLRSDVLRNVALPGDVKPTAENMQGIARVEQYLAGNSPTTYARSIADAMRNSAVGTADGVVRVDRTSLVLEASNYGGNAASVVFQRVAADVLAQPSGYAFRDGQLVNQFNPQQSAVLADLNIAQAAMLACKLTGQEHSIVRLRSSDDQTAARRAFGEPILAEQTAGGEVRALYRGGDHRVEWEMHRGAARVLEGSAKEISRESKLVSCADAAFERIPITASEKQEASAKTLVIYADSAHDALATGDGSAVIRMLRGMNQHDRDRLVRIYGAKYGGDAEAIDDVFRNEVRQKLTPRDALTVRAILEGRRVATTLAGEVSEEAYRNGHVLTESGRSKDLSSLLPDERADLDYYNKVSNKLRKNSTEREFREAQAKLLYGDCLLTDLTSKHSDGAFNSGLFGGHKINDLMTTVENMPLSKLQQFKDKQYFNDFDRALRTFCSDGERERIEDLIEAKMGRVRPVAQQETTRTLDEIIADNRMPELAGFRMGREYDGAGILSGIKNMGIADREHYVEDASYRAHIGDVLSKVLVGDEKSLAERMLAQVAATGERPELNAIDQVLFDSISPPSALDVVQHVEQAFAEDTSLHARLSNPVADADRQLEHSFRRAIYRSALSNWNMRAEDEREIEDRLMHDGRLSVDDRLKLCTDPRDLTRPEMPGVAQTELGQKLHVFAARAYERAAEFITDPNAQRAYFNAEREKLVGIGEGLHTAADEFKKAVASGWVMVTDGTVAALAQHPEVFTQPLLNAVGRTLDELQHNPEFLSTAFLSGSNALAAASDKYSNMPDREKGHVIGEAMFAFINPEGTLEAPQLLAKAAQRSDAAINAAVEMALASRTVAEARAHLQFLKEVASSGELKEWTLLQLRGPRPAFAINELESSYLMSESEGGFSWESLFGKPKPKREVGDVPSLSTQTAAHAAIDKMVAEPDLRPLRKLAQTEAEREALIAAVKQHHADMKQVLKDMVTNFPEVATDIADLERAGHRFYFPNRLEDVDSKLAKELLFAEQPKYGTCAQLRGATITADRKPRTIIPRELFDESISQWTLNRECGAIDGVMRHELGMSLIDVRGWKSLPAARLSYRQAAEEVRRQIPIVRELSLIDRHVYGVQEYGFDQTLADLYAGTHGGSTLASEVQALLDTKFAELLNHLKQCNWSRN